ncbi:hypothetical protein A374_02404 [Fictibacillus macauensis ZFHKF-1]|uniref:YdhG-like domain-containing protein n=1 Tax=Fictibacillus macauensis ZFHKF-1 TaxID=1196324 RepID=I8UJS6_9BACL|nr:DUF1801 domain-containing protein [Fictibacillus macauensis]EIT87068.1 hypothetical protein A374_02404 [Fictibacillus macauensis ZFHKF-1]
MSVTTVDQFISNVQHWQKEYEALRQIILCSDLHETMKWKHPCYTLHNRNVVLIHDFKDYIALLFHKGALMSDPHNLLIQQTENVQSARQLRFTNLQDIENKAAIITAYLHEAIVIEQEKKTLPKNTTVDLSLPELVAAFSATPAFEHAFKALTPGRQRAYILHFSQPKQSKTRQSRIEKAIEAILAGKGLRE